MCYNFNGIHTIKLFKTWFERWLFTMINIKDLAFELEVTRQTVYNHIKENDKELKACIFKQKGVTVISDAGVRIIKESMGLIKVPVVQNEEIGIQDIIKDISGSIKRDMSESMQEFKQDISLEIKDTEKNIKKDYNKLEQELAEIKKQNEKLIGLIQQQSEKENEKKGFWNIFKK